MKQEQCEAGTFESRLLAICAIELVTVLIIFGIAFL